jgi:hypothetical protein
LTELLDASDVEVWTKAAQKAEEERGEFLDIYHLKMDKGESYPVVPW